MSEPTVRGLWLAIAALASAVTGLVIGLLVSSSGMNAADAVLAGGAAAGSTLGLGLSVYRFIADGSSD